MKRFILFLIIALMSSLIIITCATEKDEEDSDSKTSASQPKPDDSSSSSSSFSSLSSDSSSNSSQVKLTLSFEYGAAGFNNNVYAVWIADSNLSFIQNMFVCNTVYNDANVSAGTLQGRALPYWQTYIYPESNDDFDSITSATVKKSDFSFTVNLNVNAPRQFTVYYETDQSWETNDWFFKDMPAVLYAAAVDLDNPAASYTLIPIGWTPYEYTKIYADGTSVNANFIIDDSQIYKLQPEMRYITNKKSGSIFGAEDTVKNSTLAVDKITVTVIQ